MPHFTYLDINEAFNSQIDAFKLEYPLLMSRSDSRNGAVVRYKKPVIIEYQNPTHRVLCNSERDCNCFFHVYEFLWMMAGREDVKSLDFYNSNMKNYSDDGKIFNGAYGNRWRNWKVPQVKNPNPDEWQSIDQLAYIIKNLKDNPDSRREVLEMWSVHSDLLRNSDQSGNFSKDVSCNLLVMFEVVRDLQDEKPEDMDIHDYVPRHVLNMTVINRSNDSIWGLLGANVVHFSFLMEYMAQMIGVEVGTYYQISNNLHLYLDKAYLDKWSKNRTNIYQKQDFDDKIIPLVSDPDSFDEEVKEFVDRFDGRLTTSKEWKNKFLETVAQPLCLAFKYHKERDYDSALSMAKTIASFDWKHVAIQWIKKRKKNWEKKMTQTLSMKN